MKQIYLISVKTTDLDITAVMCISVRRDGNGSTSTKHVNFTRRLKLLYLKQITLHFMIALKFLKKLLLYSKKVHMLRLEAAKRFKFDST